MELKRVVVTGLGSLTPLGNTTQAFWDALLNGVSGAGPITHFDASKFKTQFACELKNYDAANYFDRKEVRKIDLYTQYAMVAADEALMNSGLLDTAYDPDRVGVIWASGIGGLLTFFEEVRDFALGDGTPRFSPFFIPKMIADIAAGHISIKYNLRGPNFTTTSACASSANSLIDAFNYIRLGKADVIVTGGSEAPINPPGVGGFNALHAISTRNDDPATASRPFCKDRDGFVLGEGAGAVILEELNYALARGANIICEIAGAGLSADANHITAPHPEGYGAMMCMKNALEDAGLTIRDIDHINTHGTSTPVGDIVEPKAIVSLFGEEAYKININSTKSMTGHLLGAAGVIESIASILAVKNDIIPPTINHHTDEPEIDPKLNFTFGNKAVARKVNTALSNTFGFGGHNAAIIFKKFAL
ncbi:MAG TPA: beta-ketoacyl-ACP synthase II [Bacteroidales bacterium]|nr:beta-ketoacyl-ACP synthase II [Bacteroidales bacterium]HRZ49199.1 beta-ketoacyl-ACP synthase II [Bacteroidales bacterium]